MLCETRRMGVDKFRVSIHGVEESVNRGLCRPRMTQISHSLRSVESRPDLGEVLARG